MQEARRGAGAAVRVSAPRAPRAPLVRIDHPLLQHSERELLHSAQLGRLETLPRLWCPLELIAPCGLHGLDRLNGLRHERGAELHEAVDAGDALRGGGLARENVR